MHTRIVGLKGLSRSCGRSDLLRWVAELFQGCGSGGNFTSFVGTTATVISADDTKPVKSAVGDLPDSPFLSGLANWPLKATLSHPSCPWCHLLGRQTTRELAVQIPRYRYGELV
ncbi:hypothetical protein AVEN_66701-1 [Araneus ventricosus]|uniref:Uncharacterized protein n=1 Tax=Araneus ventricosus TaxID=182803 RepID=A0A4Y2VAH5_ARAVE|nr:hypothetical protein AVEN_109252-1 [Araneus ventricosus]GBO20710.1 hypothetical protein AVEN_66701-1 [Araneus ventricosus]